MGPDASGAGGLTRPQTVCLPWTLQKEDALVPGRGCRMRTDPCRRPGCRHRGPQSPAGDERKQSGHPAPNLAPTLILTAEVCQGLFCSLLLISAYSDHARNTTEYRPIQKESRKETGGSGLRWAGPSSCVRSMYLN